MATLLKGFVVAFEMGPAIKWDPGRGLLPIALPWLKPKQYGKPLGIVPSIEISENLNG